MVNILMELYQYKQGNWTEVINNEAYLCIRLCLGSDSIMFINMISLKGLF